MPANSAPAAVSAKFGRNFVLRLLSAAIMLPACVALVLYGGWPFALVFGLILILAFHEWVNLSRKLATWSQQMAVLAAGILYFAANIWAIYCLRFQLEQGAWLVLFIFIMVWAVDTGAYFSGRLIGGPKLAPKLSPSKTWAGAIGGAVAAGLAGYIFADLAGAAWPAMALALAVPVTFFAQSGDLLESWLKRKAGVKDASSLIPGHGGILDRIDGLLMAVPLFVLFQLLLGQFLGWW